MIKQNNRFILDNGQIPPVLYADFLRMIGANGYDKKDKSAKSDVKFAFELWREQGFINPNDELEMSALNELVTEGVISAEQFSVIAGA